MCAAAKNCEKKLLKTSFGGSKSFKVIDVNKSKKTIAIVLVMMSSIYALICIRFHTTRANSSKMTTFRGYHFLTPACAGLLELRGSVLKLLKFMFNAENFVHRLSRSISCHFAQFTLKTCAAARSHEKFTKTSNFVVQGRSKSSMLIKLKSLSPVFLTISIMSVPICNRFHTTRANNGKITSF